MMLFFIFLCMTAAALAAILWPLLRAPRGGNILTVIILIALPLGAGALYCFLGSPELRGQPYAERKHDADFALAAQAERLAYQLASNPDPAGYKHLAYIYLRLRRYDQAAEIYRALGEPDVAEAIEEKATTFRGSVP